MKIHKMMMTLVALLPMALYADAHQNNNAEKEHIKAARFAKEEEIAKLGLKILKEAEPYREYRAIALHYWDVAKEDKEKTFNDFIIKLCMAFEMSEDYESLLNKAPLVRPEHVNTQLLTLRAALQFLYLERITDQYKQAVDELVVITRTLNNLK